MKGLFWNMKGIAQNMVIVIIIAVAIIAGSAGYLSSRPRPVGSIVEVTTTIPIPTTTTTILTTTTIEKIGRLILGEWTMIKGWEDILKDIGYNEFFVTTTADALFLVSVENIGNTNIPDVVETIICNVGTGDYQILNEIAYDGFSCESGCSLLETQKFDLGGIPITLGKKINLNNGGYAWLDLRFFNSTKAGEVLIGKLVTKPTKVVCLVNVYSQSNPQISDQSTLTIEFG